MVKAEAFSYLPPLSCRASALPTHPPSTRPPAKNAAYEDLSYEPTLRNLHFICSFLVRDMCLSHPKKSIFTSGMEVWVQVSDRPKQL